MAAELLNAVRARVAAAAERAGRPPGSVMIVAVSKGRSNDEIVEVHAAGQRRFAENRAAALDERLRSGLPDDIIWHFVGSLQRRKVPLVAGRVALLHSMDRLRLGRSWVEHGGGPALMEVNVSGEEQKHGFPPDDAEEAAAGLVAAGVDLRGLMGMPAAPGTPEDSRPEFDLLRDLRDRIAVTFPAVRELSMGMTDDFEVAVDCGATIVRIGRAIFEPASDLGRGVEGKA